MSTRIYGASDDLVEFDGDVYGEVGCYGTDERERGVLVMCSDGTVLEVKYCDHTPGAWGVAVKQTGSLFDHLDVCTDADAKPHSDVAHFRDGLTWAYAATDSWELVR